MKYLNFANHIQSNEKPEILLTLIDSSGSMEYGDIKPTRRAAAIKANQEIINVKKRQHPNDKIGVIGFQATAKLVIAPRHPSDIFALQKAVDSANLSGGTDFVAPLKLAYNCFFNRAATVMNNSFSKMLSNIFFEPAAAVVAQRVDDCKVIKRIIMLTDGEHFGDGNPIVIANKLKQRGVVIDCIGIGGTPKDVDEKLLKQIASQNPDGSIRYCFIGDQETLIRKYNSLAQHIRPV